MPDVKPDTPKKQNPDERKPHPHPLMLRPKDLADRLGVTRRYLYDLLKHPDLTRRLPAPIKIGRATFWRIEDVQAWLARQGQSNAA